jgi:hypothetical protein
LIAVSFTEWNGSMFHVAQDLQLAVGGQVPTRAWDAVGISTFAPLQAPFLITNYLERRSTLCVNATTGVDGPAGVRDRHHQNRRSFVLSVSRPHSDDRNQR